MKEKILQALKTKYSNLGFSEKAFGGVAEYLATTITEEDKIETGISGVENLLKAFQSDADKIRTENANLKKQLDKSKTPPKEEDKDDPKEKDKTENKEVPEWAKGLLESNKQLAEKLAAIESGKAADNRRAQLESQIEKASEGFKKNVLKNFSRMQFKDDDDFNSYMEEVKADSEADVKEQETESFSYFPKPASSAGGSSKEASKEEIAQIMELL